MIVLHWLFDGFLMVFLMVLFGEIHDRNFKHVQRLMSNLFSLIKPPPIMNRWGSFQ